jgi:hypothetical protein
MLRAEQVDLNSAYGRASKKLETTKDQPKDEKKKYAILA